MTFPNKTSIDEFAMEIAWMFILHFMAHSVYRKLLAGDFLRSNQRPTSQRMPKVNLHELQANGLKMKTIDDLEKYFQTSV